MRRTVCTVWVTIKLNDASGHEDRYGGEVAGTLDEVCVWGTEREAIDYRDQNTPYNAPVIIVTRECQYEERA